MACLFSLALCQGRVEHSPMKKLAIEELLKDTKISAESHIVETEDGYLLEIFRLINPDFAEKGTSKPVLLQHGFLDSADSWVVSGDDKALGIFLANRGYDVWLGNNRGNKYSLGHVKKNISRREYWDFSF